MSAIRGMVGIAAAVVLALTAAPAQGGGTTFVQPTGLFPDDLLNVQAAVDAGGTVVLGATGASGEPLSFNFGPAVSRASGGRGVDITTDVSLIGERRGEAVATIVGGNEPVEVFPGVRVIVSGLTFERPFFDAIFLNDPASATIVDNRIEHVVGSFVSPSLGLALGIDVFRGRKITITGNVIDDVDAPFAVGIAVFAARDVLIAGNRVSGTNTIAIEASGNTGVTRIVDNTVAPGPERYPRGAFGAGIETNGPGFYEIRDNDATCVNPNAGCIYVFGMTNLFSFGPVVAPVIEDNRIDVGTDGGAAIFLTGQVSQARITDNKLTGTGDAAFAIFGASCCPDRSDLFGNTFLDNDLTHFTSLSADVIFDEFTHDNVFTGQCRSVIDLGVGNQITCDSPADARSSSAAAQAAVSRFQASAASERVRRPEHVRR